MFPVTSAPRGKFSTVWHAEQHLAVLLQAAGLPSKVSKACSSISTQRQQQKVLTMGDFALHSNE